MGFLLLVEIHHSKVILVCVERSLVAISSTQLDDLLLEAESTDDVSVHLNFKKQLLESSKEEDNNHAQG